MPSDEWLAALGPWGVPAAAVASTSPARPPRLPGPPLQPLIQPVIAPKSRSAPLRRLAARLVDLPFCADVPSARASSMPASAFARPPSYASLKAFLPARPGSIDAWTPLTLVALVRREERARLPCWRLAFIQDLVEGLLRRLATRSFRKSMDCEASRVLHTHATHDGRSPGPGASRCPHAPTRPMKRPPPPRRLYCASSKFFPTYRFEALAAIVALVVLVR